MSQTIGDHDLWAPNIVQVGNNIKPPLSLRLPVSISDVAKLKPEKCSSFQKVESQTSQGYFKDAQTSQVSFPMSSSSTTSSSSLFSFLCLFVLSRTRAWLWNLICLTGAEILKYLLPVLCPWGRCQGMAEDLGLKSPLSAYEKISLISNPCFSNISYILGLPGPLKIKCWCLSLTCYCDPLASGIQVLDSFSSLILLVLIFLLVVNDRFPYRSLLGSWQEGDGWFWTTDLQKCWKFLSIVSSQIFDKFCWTTEQNCRKWAKYASFLLK